MIIWDSGLLLGLEMQIQIRNRESHGTRRREEIREPGDDR